MPLNESSSPVEVVSWVVASSAGCTRARIWLPSFRATLWPRRALPEGVRIAGYTPTQEGPWFDEIAHTDAVVDLTGEQIVGVRWNDAKKAEFEASRIGANAMLVNAIERVPEKHRPKVLIGASGIGYYGPRGSDEELDETSPAGRDYIALLAQRWEEALARSSTSGRGSCTRGSA